MMTEKLNLNDTLCIFCDASMGQHYAIKGKVGCAGAIATYFDNENTNKFVDETYSIIMDSTNNESELTAILLGVGLANMYRNSFTPNTRVLIFSDSNLSISTLRDWVVNKWCLSPDRDLIKTDGALAMNSNIISSIIAAIVASDLKVQFIHQKGHVNITSPEDIQGMINVFKRINNMHINYSQASQLSFYNYIVDKKSRDLVVEYVNSMAAKGTANQKTDTRIVNYKLTDDIMDQYRSAVVY